MCLSGMCLKRGVSKEDTIKLIESVFNGDDELDDRLSTVETTYSQDIGKVLGYNGLKDLIPEKTAKEIYELLKGLAGDDAELMKLLTTPKKIPDELLARFLINYSDNVKVGYDYSLQRRYIIEDGNLVELTAGCT